MSAFGIHQASGQARPAPAGQGRVYGEVDELVNHGAPYGASFQSGSMAQQHQQQSIINSTKQGKLAKNDKQPPVFDAFEFFPARPEMGKDAWWMAWRYRLKKSPYEVQQLVAQGSKSEKGAPSKIFAEFKSLTGPKKEHVKQLMQDLWVEGGIQNVKWEPVYIMLDINHKTRMTKSFAVVLKREFRTGKTPSPSIFKYAVEGLVDISPAFKEQYTAGHMHNARLASNRGYTAAANTTQPRTIPAQPKPIPAQNVQSKQQSPIIHLGASPRVAGGQNGYVAGSSPASDSSWDTFGSSPTGARTADTARTTVASSAGSGSYRQGSNGKPQTTYHSGSTAREHTRRNPVEYVSSGTKYNSNEKDSRGFSDDELPARVIPASSGRHDLGKTDAKGSKDKGRSRDRSPAKYRDRKNPRSSKNHDRKHRDSQPNFFMFPHPASDSEASSGSDTDSTSDSESDGYDDYASESASLSSRRRRRRGSSFSTRPVLVYAEDDHDDRRKNNRHHRWDKDRSRGGNTTAYYVPSSPTAVFGRSVEQHFARPRISSPRRANHYHNDHRDYHGHGHGKHVKIAKAVLVEARREDDKRRGRR